MAFAVQIFRSWSWSRRCTVNATAHLTNFSNRRGPARQKRLQILTTPVKRNQIIKGFYIKILKVLQSAKTVSQVYQRLKVEQKKMHLDIEFCKIIFRWCLLSNVKRGGIYKKMLSKMIEKVDHPTVHKVK